MLIKTDQLLYNWYSGSMDISSRKNNFTSFINDCTYSSAEVIINSIDTFQPINDIDEWKDPVQFENLISKLYVTPGQKIRNIGEMHQRLMSFPIHLKWNILDLILPTTQRKLETKITHISNAEKELLDLILRTIYIENGHPSELWFAIIFNGKVCGGVSKDGSVESDVNVNGKGVSLKNYKKLSGIDLGSMSGEFVSFLNKFLALNSILLNKTPNKTLDRTSINEMLESFDTSDWNDSVGVLNTIENPITKNILSHIRNIEKDNSIRSGFCNALDTAIYEKINSVNFWCFLVLDKLIVLDSAVIFNKLKTEDMSIRKSIKCFHQFKLFISGAKVLEYMGE